MAMTVHTITKQDTIKNLNLLPQENTNYINLLNIHFKIFKLYEFNNFEASEPKQVNSI